MRFGIALALKRIRAARLARPLDVRTNDPRAKPKQIRLQYAGIGADYGWDRANRLTFASAPRRQILRRDINRLAARSIGENAARRVGQADKAVASQSR
jgi:hypothetical protein